MKIEYEARILEINKEELITKLEEFGADFINNFEQKRVVYDFSPKKENSWIRLRSDGYKTTLTIKEINNDNLDGTGELEIEVSSFENTNLILNKLGYNSKGYQENRRTRYMYNNIGNRH